MYSSAAGEVIEITPPIHPKAKTVSILVKEEVFFPTFRRRLVLFSIFASMHDGRLLSTVEEAMGENHETIVRRVESFCGFSSVCH